MPQPTEKHLDASLMLRLKNLPAYVGDRDTPIWKKISLVLVIIYVVSPVDAIPDIPFIGWLDDIGIVGLTSAWLMRELDTFIRRRAQTPAVPDATTQRTV